MRSSDSMQPHSNKVYALPRIVDFEIVEYVVGGEHVPRLKMYVSNGKNTREYILPDIDPQNIDIYLKTNDGKKQLLRTILGIITKEYNIMNNIEYIIELTNDPTIIEKIKQAFNEYRMRKTGLRIEELKVILPPKTHVFIEKELYRIEQYTLLIYEIGKDIKKIGPLDPVTTDNIIKNWSRGNKYAVIETLKIRDINMDNVRIEVIPRPWVFIYGSNSNIIISYEPLRLGENELRLQPADYNQVISIIDKLTLVEKTKLFKTLSSVFNYKKQKIKNPEEEIDINLRELIDKNISKILIAETGLDKKLVGYLINKYNEYISNLYNSIEQVDPLVLNIYKAMSLPYFDPLYSPHVLLVTTTNAGKTYLYTLLVNEQGPFTRATSMSLVGGIGPDKKPVYGILHRQQYAIQIEGLEANEEKKIMQYLLDYMKSGRAISGVYGKVIKAQGTAPLILTANIIKHGKAYTMQDWIQKGLLDNPEALGSRLLFFYKNTKQLLFREKKILEETCNILRELFKSSTIKFMVKKIWEHEEIRKWLETPDQIEVSIKESEKTLSTLHHYLDVLAKNFYRKLRGLALNTALFDMLDIIYMGKYKIEDIIQKANEYYEYYKEEMRKSILTVLEEIIMKDPTSLALSLPKLLKAMIITINQYQNDKVVIMEDRVDIDINELIDHMVKYGYINENNKRKYKERLLKYIKKYDRELRSLGIYLVENKEEKTIVVDNNMFNGINMNELSNEIERDRA